MNLATHNSIHLLLELQGPIKHLKIIVLIIITNATRQDKGIEIWARPISPVAQGHYSYAIAFLNRRTDGTPSEVRELEYLELEVLHHERLYILFELRRPF